MSNWWIFLAIAGFVIFLLSVRLKQPNQKKPVTRKNHNRVASMKNSSGMREALQREVEVSGLAKELESRPLSPKLPKHIAVELRKLAITTLWNGRRAESIASEIMKNHEVLISKNDLNVIAGSEIFQASFAHNAARAKRVGSKYYIWRTSKDAAVCQACAKKQGKRYSWDKRPRNGGYPGEGQCCPSGLCRCTAAAVIPDEFGV